MPTNRSVLRPSVRLLEATSFSLLSKVGKAGKIEGAAILGYREGIGPGKHNRFDMKPSVRYRFGYRGGV